MGKVAWAVAVIDVLVTGVWIARLWPSDQTGFGGPDLSGSDAAAPLEGASLVDVALPFAFSPEAEIGERIFDEACASCHGLNAAGRTGAGPSLVNRVYEPSHHADIAFAMAVRSGVRAHHWQFGSMPAAEEQLTNAEIGYVVRYIRELQQANGIL